MDLSGHIRDLVTVAKEMRNAPNVNKQWLNKTIARLEEAEVFSEKVVSGRVQGVPNTTSPITGSTCTCPNGAIDLACPVHHA